MKKPANIANIKPSADSGIVKNKVEITPKTGARALITSHFNACSFSPLFFRIIFTHTRELNQLTMLNERTFCPGVNQMFFKYMGPTVLNRIYRDSEIRSF